MIIHSKVCWLICVSIQRAAQIPNGMNGNTHHNDSNSGTFRTPVYKKPGTLIKLRMAKNNAVVAMNRRGGIFCSSKYELNGGPPLLNIPDATPASPPAAGACQRRGR